MKTLLSIVFIYLFGSFVISADSIPHHETEGSDEYDILRHCIPDSIYNLLQEKPFFARIFGHYGHSWALFTRNDRDSIVIYHGHSEYRKHMAEENRKYNIDEFRLIQGNLDVINWGLDSVPILVQNMKPQIKELYISGLEVVCGGNSCTDSYYILEYLKTFEGPNSKEFNRRFFRLNAMLLYILIPRITTCLPDSELYEFKF